MARPMSGDFLSGMRFHVVSVNTGGVDRLLPTDSRLNAGFSACTTPEVSAEAVEYREGVFVYTYKYPGIPSMGGDITLSRGVTRLDSSFYAWMRMIIEGEAGVGEYRADLMIKQFHRANVINSDPSNIQNRNTIDINSPAAKTYTIFEAFPVRCKPAADFDATSSDVSIAELDVAYESFLIESTP